MIRLDDKTTGESFSVNITKFPDGTSQVWKTHIPPSEHTVSIYWQFENEAELFHLMQLNALLIGHNYVYLQIPFLPYGRQDKYIDVNNTFALHCFAQLINLTNFDIVETYDVHSNKAKELIDDLINVMPKFQCGNVTYVLPDKGAKRYLDCLPENAQFIICDKVRDQSTGYITSYKINGNVEGKDVIVIDDVVDGGLTFKILGEQLKQQKVKTARLHVSHGIFSKGAVDLRQFYDRITCVNLLNPSVKDQVEVVNGNVII